MPGSGIIPIPTRAFYSTFFGNPQSFELETHLQNPRYKRVNCGPIRPRITEVWLINGFTIPFLIAIGSLESGEAGEAPLEIPDIQMDIYDNNTLVYSSGLAAITPQVAQAGATATPAGWGLLSADLTNPIPVESHSQIEIGVRGFAPQRNPASKSVVEMALNYTTPPGESVINVLAEIITNEQLGKGMGNGPGNFRYEAVDK